MVFAKNKNEMMGNVQLGIFIAVAYLFQLTSCKEDCIGLYHPGDKPWLQLSKPFVLPYKSLEPEVGLKKYEAYLIDEFHYPRVVMDRKIYGEVKVELTLDALGNPIEVLTSGIARIDGEPAEKGSGVKAAFGFGVDEEIERVILSAGRWKLDKGRNKETDRTVTIPFFIHSIRSCMKPAKFYSSAIYETYGEDFDSLIRNGDEEPWEPDRAW